jgi:hypothetical protein
MFQPSVPELARILLAGFAIGIVGGCGTKAPPPTADEAAKSSPVPPPTGAENSREMPLPK